MSATNLGRLFMLGFRGETVPDWLRHAIKGDQLGGVVLFDKNVDGSVQNISSPAQLKTLTQELQDLASGELLIAVDQEGGRVRRLKAAAGFPELPGAAELAAAGVGVSAVAAAVCAEMLADAGVNMNFAPVVDLDCTPSCPVIGGYGRSFGADAAVVTRHAAHWITAHHQRGIACCLKHFPGHGRATADTHKGFVDASPRWQEDELLPYSRLIQAGFRDAVMGAHLVLGCLDSEACPATLSRPMLTGILRERLGFTGLICTDDMQMGAITQQYGYREAVQRAVLAGADMIVVGNNLAFQPDALTEGVAAIGELLQRGQITEERLAASIRRVAELRHGEKTPMPML